MPRIKMPEQTVGKESIDLCELYTLRLDGPDCFGPTVQKRLCHRGLVCALGSS